jgi:CheY-like chemotaxis protein
VVRLHQVLKNLLSNAFKFTKKGSVSIRVDRALSGWSSGNESLNSADFVLAFTVEDTGIGISNVNQEIIFAKFHQEEAGASRRFGGTGLGLSISREIAILLGAELKLVQSALQIGSTFTLFLPCGKIEDIVVQAEDFSLDADVLRENDKRNFGGKKVLIVDDDKRNIIALTAVLEDRGAIVFAEESGRGAINLLTQTPDINLVLMDIMMPEMDGYETIREIRTMELFAELPIIALTAKAMVGDREKCIEAGASDYFSKPINVEKLSAMMQGWLD